MGDEYWARGVTRFSPLQPPCQPEAVPVVTASNWASGSTIRGANLVTPFHGLATPASRRERRHAAPHRRGMKIGLVASLDSPPPPYRVSMFSHYEDMKGDEKCKTWGCLGVKGHPGSSETLPFNRTHMSSYSTLIETMHLSCTLFELLSLISQNLNVT